MPLEPEIKAPLKLELKRREKREHLNLQSIGGLLPN
jgi:hypothetical protein